MTSLAELTPAHLAASGDWTRDNAIGRAFALRLISQSRAHGETPLIFGAIRALAQSERCTGIEVGFAQAIAEACIR